MPPTPPSGSDGELKAGIAWFAVEPKINGAGKVEGQVKKQGYIALANNNLTYPAIAMTTSGKGVIAFTVVGEDYYPSAGYVTIDANGTVGPIHIAAAGLGRRRRVHELQGVRRRSAADPLGRLRRGRHRRQLDLDRLRVHRPDLHATRSTTRARRARPFGSCGGTRTSLANWGTRISKLTP